MSKLGRATLGLVLAVGGVRLLTACGPGSAAKAVRPNMPTGESALGQGACDPTPYIVDLDPREIADLERKFAQGIVVVKRDCKSPMKILADCSVKGSYPGIYTYAGTSSFESLQSLKDADDIKAHLATGPALAATLDAEVKRGTSIDIAFQQIGTANTSKVIGRDDLAPSRAGGCDGATHFIETFYLGAFLTKASTAADVNATASVFKQGGSATSASSAFQEHHLGKATVCSGVSQKDNTQPVDDCRAPVSVKLAAISEDSPSKAVESGQPAPPPDFRPIGTTTKTCRGSSADLCAKACSAGDGPSCASAGFLYEEGRGGLARPDFARAFDFYKKGCDGGSSDACAGLGLLYSRGDAPGGKNLSEADRLLGPACSGGSARGCSGVGTKALFEEKNPDKAIEYLERGCRLGYARACFYAGSEMITTGRDPKRAFVMIKRSCDALDLRGCLLASLFTEQEDGPGLRQRALAGLERGCEGRKNGEDCRALGKWYRGDYDPKQADTAKTKAYFARACQFNEKLCNEPAPPSGGGASATASVGPSSLGAGGDAASSISGFAVRNDTPWPVCTVEAGKMKSHEAVFLQNYVPKRIEHGATGGFVGVPDTGSVIRFVTCDKSQMGIAVFNAGQPATFVLEAPGARPGANVIFLAPASRYAKTPYALR